MTIEDYLNNERNGLQIESPTNDKYIKLATQKGKEETKEIMKDYMQALKEAAAIYIR